MRFTLRLLNAGIALATLASALAVLASDFLVSGYRDHYLDAPWFVTVYATVQVVMLVGFLRDGRLVPWLALAKAVAAALLLANFAAFWPRWQTWTPARYVYQFFAWQDQTRVGLFGLVFLGRGAFNAVNAMYFTQPWWGPLRVRRPLLGRAVTAVPIAATAFCVWAFLGLVHEEYHSAGAQEVARMVLADLDCAAVRTRAGSTTTDLRQRGDRQYHVQIVYGCDVTRVVVRTEDGYAGTASEPRTECCQ